MIEYRFLAVGYLCVALNFQINGLGVLLPTTFGYAIIFGACISLSKLHPVYRFALIPSALLTLFTFPDLFRGAVKNDMATLDYWLGWPVLILFNVLFISLVIGLIKEANIKNNSLLVVATAIAIPVEIVAIGCYWFIPTETKPLFVVWALSSYLGSFYLAAVSELMFRSVP